MFPGKPGCRDMYRIGPTCNYTLAPFNTASFSHGCCYKYVKQHFCALYVGSLQLLATIKSKALRGTQNVDVLGD